jgi:hypothetical protein
MEAAAKLSEYQDLLILHPRWQTSAEQPLHPTSLNQLLHDEIGAIRVSEFIAADLTRMIQKLKIIQDVRSKGMDVKIDTVEGFDVAQELIELLNSSARHQVSRSADTVGQIRKIRPDEKILPQDAVATHTLKGVSAQLRWFLPLDAGAEHLKLNVRHGTEEAAKIEMQTGDLILMNARNEGEIVHHGASVVVMEGFVGQLSTGELVLWSK